MTKLSEPYNMTYQLLDCHIENDRADKVAILLDDEAWKYSQLFELLLKIQALVENLNYIKGTMFLCLFQDSFLSVCVFLGLIRAGMVPVYVNPGLLTQQYDDIVAIAEPAALFYGKELSDDLMEWIRNSPHPCFLIQEEGLLFPFSSNLSIHMGDSERAAFVLFTSGSTGKPKGVIHRHQDLEKTCKSYVKTVVNMTAKDIVYSTSKLFFAYGLNSLLYSLYHYATVRLPSKKLDIAAVWKFIDNDRVSVFFSVPTLYDMLLKVKNNLTVSSLRLTVSAGEVLPITLYERWLSKTGVSILDGIGTTEVLSTFISNTSAYLLPGSTGKVVPGFQAKICSESGDQLKTNDIGVLWVKGETYFDAYLNNKEMTKKHFYNGWFITYDLFSVNEEGFYFYHGRANEIIKCGGRWIFPIKIEETIKTHHLVDDCIVARKLQENGLSRPIAHILLKKPGFASDLLAEELKKLCKDTISPWEYPHFIRFTTTLPRTATGKKQRYKLQEYTDE